MTPIMPDEISGELPKIVDNNVDNNYGDVLQLRQHAIKTRTRATRAAGDAPEATIDRAGDWS